MHMGLNPPLVSIYMPTFRRPVLLQRAVESVLNQSYENIELIVVVDDSCDHQSICYLKERQELDGRLKYIVNQRNLGACASRNKAIQLASGEFVTGIDDDDYFLPERIEQFVSSWHPEDRMVATFTDAIVKSETGTFKKTSRPDLVSRKKLLFNNCVGNQVFTKTSFLRNEGGFDADFKAWQDLECWYRLTHESKFMRKVAAANYVVDKSHPHERISSSKLNVIDETYGLFCDKHKLSSLDAEILRGHTYFYAPNKVDFSLVVKRLVRTKSVAASVVVLKIWIRNFINNRL